MLRKHEEKIDSDESKESYDRWTTVFILLLTIPTTNLCMPKLSLLHIFLALLIYRTHSGVRPSLWCFLHPNH